MKAAIPAAPEKESHSKEEGQEEEEEEEEVGELRRGPWTLEEDTLLIHSIARYGEGRWNSLAEAAGLKRTGKSCRLRWLNYLKPDIKRGNLTPQEQLMILELHSKWGNRWSKIAAHLPGRTDNEIKNYWRTRVQKQARQLNMESNSQSFIDAIRCFYMPRLVQKIEQNSSSSSSSSTAIDADSSTFSSLPHKSIMINHAENISNSIGSPPRISSPVANISESQTSPYPALQETVYNSNKQEFSLRDDCYYVDSSDYDMEALASISAAGASDLLLSDCHVARSNWLGDVSADDTWNLDELWQFRK
ncbi:hypothetical protein Nepgr_028076 [Nepenthes gracilis]|uniref:Uncharacterized protein n=1 Tax=Nepenthes gracilis TaxID=150966 RepID=A0AAD3Y225_NEPGR|nr:hypothetical protein Nepgr_028076 [Nepenthes gracilis]